MNVLVIGSGGREHALVWKISKSPYVEKIYCVPGNGGISSLAQCEDIDIRDFKGLCHFAEKHVIDLTVVGPELPLTLGIVDAFRKKGLTAFGPTADAAILEGSKAFTKNFLVKYSIPTALYEIFTNPDDAVRYVHQHEPPFVLKADGLASGKGVLICHTRSEAFRGIDDLMKKKIFGNAGDHLVIEEFMTGEEASILAVTDGESYVTLPAAQDHKAIFEGDKGPNTGGMGAYSPVSLIDEHMMKRIHKEILDPTLSGMRAEGRSYQGVLYTGLMITAEGPKVVEFNCRFGDPETQAILPLLKTDLVDLMIEVTENRLKSKQPEIFDQSSMCVVMASGGYPGDFQKGKQIFGLDNTDPDVQVFHAGTRREGGQVVTSGGRVLGVTAIGEALVQARNKAYQAVGKITFDGAYYRRDIGHRALRKDDGSGHAYSG
jgi:phosphoribosylamine--glycine ligase